MCLHGTEQKTAWQGYYKICLKGCGANLEPEFKRVWAHYINAHTDESDHSQKFQIYLLSLGCLQYNPCPSTRPDKCSKNMLFFLFFL